MSFIAKTRAEQELEFLFQSSKHRKLTEEEWKRVSACEHAIYERIRRQQIREAEREEKIGCAA